MFVITLVPSSDARGNIGKSLEIFHYLGGGDFTGRVFCSTLEGEFVKAFGYTDGRLSGRLLVMKRSELTFQRGAENPAGKITAAKIAKIFQTFPDISTGIGRWHQSDHKHIGLSAATTGYNQTTARKGPLLIKQFARLNYALYIQTESIRLKRHFN